MAVRISVIIPVRNGSRTLGACLEALFASLHNSFEVVVVDDHSDDNSAEIAAGYPCRLVKLERPSGASRARNEGARQGHGRILFFIDADCLVQRDTLSVVEKTITGREQTVFGGTYTPLPHDKDFFSKFQSIFINYSETKFSEPDYIAAHALVIEHGLFTKQGGFPEEFLPIIEDVEFSHRLRRSGIPLHMNPSILVTHIFNFTLRKSLRNAFRKSHYWTMYSLKNSDLTKDSGTASLELKMTVFSWSLTISAFLLYLISGTGTWLLLIGAIQTLNLAVSRRLLGAFFRSGGVVFGTASALYYTMLYPGPVGLGGMSALVRYFISYRKKGF